MEEENKPILSMVVTSDDLEKTMINLIIATGAASSGYDVRMFFAFWGLNVIRKKKSKLLKGKHFLQKIFSFLNRTTSFNVKLSKFNMLGLGTSSIRYLMKKKGISSPENLLSMAKQLGVKFYVCDMTNDMFGFERDDLMQELITDYIGVYSFVDTISESKHCLTV